MRWRRPKPRSGPPGAPARLDLAFRLVGPLRRFVVYGLLGWCLEIGFTAARAAATGSGDRRLQGVSYLWMHPIYGAGGLAMEVVHRGTRRQPWWARAVSYAATCLVLEFASGWLLRRTTGACPWDYGERGINIDGLARLDYAPYWAVAGLAAEPVASVLRRVRVEPRASA
jgi:uncharacterized membrane protein